MKITSLWNMTIEIIVKSSNWAHVRPMTSIATLQAPREPCQSHGTVRTARCWWTPARTASRRNRIRIQNWIVAIWWVKTFKTLYLYLCIYIYTITQYIYNIYIVYVYMYSECIYIVYIQYIYTYSIFLYSVYIYTVYTYILSIYIVYI